MDRDYIVEHWPVQLSHIGTDGNTHRERKGERQHSVIKLFPTLVYLASFSHETHQS